MIKYGVLVLLAFGLARFEIYAQSNDEAPVDPGVEQHTEERNFDPNAATARYLMFNLGMTPSEALRYMNSQRFNHYGAIAPLVGPNGGAGNEVTVPFAMSAGQGAKIARLRAQAGPQGGTSPVYNCGQDINLGALDANIDGAQPTNQDTPYLGNLEIINLAPGSPRCLEQE